MRDWMRKYEEMLDNFVDGILASNEEMVMHLKIAGFKCPIYNISGLAFNKKQVQDMAGEIPSFYDRPEVVSWASRLDEEKNVNFFLDIIEKTPDIQYQILQGGKLRSNNSQILARLEKGLPNLKIYTNLKKTEYYNHLKNSRVLFNCALQDWTSNTLSEADALGCNVVFPSYRSFPEVVGNHSGKLFVTWDKTDALFKLQNALRHPIDIGPISDWTDKTNSRILDIMINEKNSKWYRPDETYRQNVVEDKIQWQKQR